MILAAETAKFVDEGGNIRLLDVSNPDENEPFWTESESVSIE